MPLSKTLESNPSKPLVSSIVHQAMRFFRVNGACRCIPALTHPNHALSEDQEFI